MVASTEVAAKLSLSLEDLAKQDSSSRGKNNKGGKGGNKGGNKKGGGSSSAHAEGSVFSRLGNRPGGKGKGKGQGKWRKHMSVREEDGDTVVTLHETDVVRITASDIIVSHGGFQTSSTMDCINEALGPYTFRVSESGGEWYVSDSKYRLIRFIDGGAIITGAAKEKREETAPGPGPVRIVKPTSLAAAYRHRPY